MGGWFSSEKEENNEQKTVDSSGHVNNNIIIQEANDTHRQMLTNEKLLIATYFLCGVELLRLFLFAFHSYKKNMKKKYKSRESA